MTELAYIFISILRIYKSAALLWDCKVDWTVMSYLCDMFDTSLISHIIQHPLGLVFLFCNSCIYTLEQNVWSSFIGNINEHDSAV